MALPVRRFSEPSAPAAAKQVALQSALQVLNSGSELDRPDTPDEVVTAVRRLPAVEAAYAPFPADIDPRAWPEVIRPALSDRKGRATFVGTPKGRNWLDRKSVV